MSTKTSVVIGADHGGFDLKQIVVEYLKTKPEIDLEDVGILEYASVDYPEIAASVCKSVLDNNKVGIVVCGTGIGISIAANKIDGIRCALCHDHYTAKMARQHNNSNVLSLGGRVTGPEVAKEIVDVFLREPFSTGQQHHRRVAKIHEFETKGTGQ